MDTQILSQQIWEIINQKTKPPGSLGQLETLAHDLALNESIKAGSLSTNITVGDAQVIVFAADHGIAAEGVSIAPSEVTQQMVHNFVGGGAAINCFSRANQIDFKVVDAGMLASIESESVTEQRLGAGTANIANEPAMSLEQMEQGLSFGAESVKQAVESGKNLLLFGEMGIGNTSPAAALLAYCSGRDVPQCVGLGTGISNEQYIRKVALITKAVQRCEATGAKEILADLGGFEIVQMVGGFIECGRQRVPVIVDGFIATSAAYLATLIEPSCREVMIFAHQSHEAGHKYLLEELNAKPLLDLELRLGEGTGAALAVPLVRSAAEFYNNMASFADAGVTV